MVAIHGLLRDAHIGVYVLANRDHAELRHAIMLNVFDRFIGGAGAATGARICKRSTAICRRRPMPRARRPKRLA